MSPRYRDIFRAVSLFTVFCVLHIYVFTGPATAAPNAVPQASGTLKTTNNQPVIINGNSVPPGTTVLSGSTIQTPAGVAATLNLGFATIEISPESEVMVEFTADGNVKVTLKRGCAVINTNGDATGTIISPDGTTTTTGNKKRASVCFPLQGSTVPPSNGGISGAMTALLIAGGGIAVAVILLANRGGNPSPSTP